MSHSKKYIHKSFEGFIIVHTNKIVCPQCKGKGTHFRSDLDENSLIQNIVEDGDNETLEAYHKGSFDQICSSCKGKNVIDDIDWERANREYPLQIEELREWEREERIYNNIKRQERAMNA